MTMLSPIFLVMGAPATFALRALSRSGNERGPREWLVWFFNSPITRVATNPFFVFIVYVIGLYGLYMTPPFGWSWAPMSATSSCSSTLSWPPISLLGVDRH